VGIVSRSDLLEGLLRPDEELRQETLKKIIFGRFALAPDRFTVTLSDGVVGLSGRGPQRDLIPALVRAVRRSRGSPGSSTGLRMPWTTPPRWGRALGHPIPTASGWDLE
jgi:hypothetical protein